MSFLDQLHFWTHQPSRRPPRVLASRPWPSQPERETPRTARRVRSNAHPGDVRYVRFGWSWHVLIMTGTSRTELVSRMPKKREETLCATRIKERAKNNLHMACNWSLHVAVFNQPSSLPCNIFETAELPLRRSSPSPSIQLRKTLPIDPTEACAKRFMSTSPSFGSNGLTVCGMRPRSGPVAVARWRAVPGSPSGNIRPLAVNPPLEIGKCLQDFARICTLRRLTSEEDPD